MSNSSGQPRPPKKDRRDEAREHARLMREVKAKRDKRRTLFVRGGIGVGLIAATAIVALIIVNNASSNTAAAAGPLNMASDGILLSGDGAAITATPTTSLASGDDPIATNPISDTLNFVTYVDYLCPACNAFESANAEKIASWVSGGKASLEIHPISILDRLSSGTKYSTRAANAAACVANYEPDNYLKVSNALFANQPAENSTGMTDAELTTLLTSTGVTDKKVATCITDQTFADWVKAATARALKGPIPNADIKKVGGTPTVIVNGVYYTGGPGDAAAFDTLVQSQAAALGIDLNAAVSPTPAATPTPTSTP